MIVRIYQLEKSIHQPSIQSQDAEVSPLIGSDDPDAFFRRALNQELEKICSFYQLKELEIYGEADDLMKDEEAFKAETDGMDMEQLDGGQDVVGKRRQSLFGRYSISGRKRRTSTMSASTIEEGDEDSDEDPNDRSAMNSSFTSRDRRKTYDANAAQALDDLRSSRELPPMSRRRTGQAYQDFSDQALTSVLASGLTLKKRTVSIYVTLCELKSFIQLNKTGFSKVLKKYDKILDRTLKTEYLQDSVAPAYPFRQTTMAQIDERIQNIEKAYANVLTKGDLSTARRELRLHLREHVVWERNTVWREMIGIERKAQAANMGIRQTLLGVDHDPAKARLQGDDPDEMSSKELVTPVGRYRCPHWLFSSTFFFLLAILAVFVALLIVPIMEKREQQNCLAMLVFVSLLWATEVSRKSDFRTLWLTHDRSYRCSSQLSSFLSLPWCCKLSVPIKNRIVGSIHQKPPNMSSLPCGRP